MVKKTLIVKAKQVQKEPVVESVPAKEKRFTEWQELNDIIEQFNNDDYVFMRLPLLDTTAISREDLSLSDRIIFFTILARNFEGKYFNEKTNFFVELLGIKKSQVEKSLKKLLSENFIYRVDNKGEVCYDKKPMTTKEFEILKKQKATDYNSSKTYYINDKRELLASPEWFTAHTDSFRDYYYKTDEEKKAIRRKRREEKIKLNEINIKCSGILITLKSYDILEEEIIKMSEINFKKSNKKKWSQIELLLLSFNVTLDDLIEYINHK
ncbi:MAG: hypothetical protein EPN82_14415 [Bacteroidetes bacterium]|nr:MAG: hypothetical protein EPN82_14415 [Bacteroidota bacterium]